MWISGIWILCAFFEYFYQFAWNWSMLRRGSELIMKINLKSAFTTVLLREWNWMLQIQKELEFRFFSNINVKVKIQGNWHLQICTYITFNFDGKFEIHQKRIASLMQISSWLKMGKNKFYFINFRHIFPNRDDKLSIQSHNVWKFQHQKTSLRITKFLEFKRFP